MCHPLLRGRCTHSCDMSEHCLPPIIHSLSVWPPDLPSWFSLTHSQARVTQLESALAAAEREAAAAQKAASWRKDTEAESAVAASERAGRAEAALAKAETEGGQLRARVSHLEHTLRSR